MKTSIAYCIMLCFVGISLTAMLVMYPVTAEDMEQIKEELSTDDIKELLSIHEPAGYARSYDCSEHEDLNNNSRIEAEQECKFSGFIPG